MDRIKRIWYLSHMRAAKVQASLRIRTVSPKLPLLARISNESRGTFRQTARSLAPLNGWACAVKICHDGMLEDKNSLDGAQMVYISINTAESYCTCCYTCIFPSFRLHRNTRSHSRRTIYLLCCMTDPCRNIGHLKVVNRSFTGELVMWYY